jgi:hypothetical protein
LIRRGFKIYPSLYLLIGVSSFALASLGLTEYLGRIIVENSLAII